MDGESIENFLRGTSELSSCQNEPGGSFNTLRINFLTKPIILYLSV